jgi:sugar lactone lactonase YvrE
MQVLIAPNAECNRFLPEGPRCVTIRGREALAWVNIQTGADAASGAIHLRFWDSGELRELPQPSRPGFLFPTDRDGFVVVGRDKEVGLLDLRTNAWTHWATIPDADPCTIINDGEIVPGGRAFVFGTKDTRFIEPIAHLYLCTLPDRELTTLADQQLCSNGKVFAQSPDGLLLFDIDTPKRNVVRYGLDLDKRRLSGGEVALDLSKIEGFPDGMVDAGDGSVIIAFYTPSRGGDGHALRFDLATGAVVEKWITPGSPRVTCPLLIERGGKVQLILTTAVEGMSAEMRAGSPEAGSLFIGETSISKLPETEVVLQPANFTHST